MENISFILGAGISLKAGMPTTKDITECVLYGINKNNTLVNYYTDESFYYSKTRNKNLDNIYFRDYILPVLKFVKIIRGQISNYYYFPINYEHIYYSIDNIFSSHPNLQEYENPICEPFVTKIEEVVLKQNLVNKENGLFKIHSLIQLCSYTLNYIHDTLVSSLRNSTINELGYLSFLEKAYDDQYLNNIFIFTLNHDTVLEEFFVKNKIEFNDGFETVENFLSTWKPNYFLNNSKISLLKLHGSINWYRVRPYYINNKQPIRDPDTLEEINDDSKNIDPWKDEFICKAKYLINNHIGKNINELYTDKYNRRFDIIEKRPKVLIGTINKLLEYNGGIYNDLQFYFRKQLNESNRLVIAGYSLGDRGVNNQIIDWIYKDYDKRKILIIDPNIEKLKSSYNAISKKFDLWFKNKRIDFLEDYIQNVSWDQIKNRLIY